MVNTNHLSSIFSILLSLSFVYNLVNTNWINVVDFILQKKPGKDKIHLIWVIGKLSAEINTMMKHYSKTSAQRYKKSSPCNKQQCGRNNILSTDTVVIKMVAYTSARMKKNTMVILKFIAAADFNRMYHRYVNMLDVKKYTEQTICKHMSATIEAATRVHIMDGV